MSQRHRDLLLMCAAQDRTFAYSDRSGWLGKCIHCRRKVGLEADGRPFGGTTLEHIVPRTHGGTDELENLSIACSRCNGQKGRKVDVLAWGDPKLSEMIARLVERRQDRLRPLSDRGCIRLRRLLEERGTS